LTKTIPTGQSNEYYSFVLTEIWGGGPKELNIKVVITYTDGTTATFDDIITQTITDADVGGVCTLTGYYTVDDISQVEWQIYADTEVVKKRINYDFTFNECENEQYIELHWVNRMGGLESFTFQNTYNLSANVDKFKANKFLPFQITGTEAIEENIITDKSNIIITNGSISNETEWWFFEGMISGKFHKLFDGIKFIPVRILSNNINYDSNSGKGEYEIQLKLNY